MSLTITARAALLDMDGTLVDSHAVVERLWLEWAAPHGLDPATVLRTVHGQQGHLSMAMLLPDRDHSINRAENALMLDRETIDTDGVVAIHGAATFLAALAPFPHAIVTSANHPLMTARMRAAGLTVPELAITAESVVRSKPDPEGFLAGAQALSIPAAECVVFEDSGAGIRAGLDAGMTVIGVGELARGFAPTHHVDDLARIDIHRADVGFTLTLN